MNPETFAKTLTVMVRIFGVFALAISPMSFLGALIDPESRWLFVISGLFLVAVGIGCLRGTAITAEQIDKFPKD